MGNMVPLPNHFYGHQTYHGLVPPSNPMVQAVLQQLLATQDYFFFALNPDQTATAFRSGLGESDIAGLTTTFARLGAGVVATDDYEHTVAIFAQAPDPLGLVVPWVCRANPAYLDLTTDRLELNPAPERRAAAPADGPPGIIWQPLNMLPMMVRMAEQALADAQAQLRNIQAAQTRPGVLDAPTVARAQRVYAEQRDFLTIYLQQAQRWREELLTRQQGALLDQLEATTAEALAVNADLLALLDGWQPR